MEKLKSYEALWSRIDFWDTTDTSEHSHQVWRFSKTSPVLLIHYTKQTTMNKYNNNTIKLMNKNNKQKNNNKIK